MKATIVRVVVATAAAAVVPLVGGLIAPANATACVWQYVSTSKHPAQSGVMNSSSTCNNLWAARTAYFSDWIRGQYNNRDGSGWHYSSVGRKYIHPYKTQKKIVADTTVNGERDRGVAKRYNQLVRYAY